MSRNHAVVIGGSMAGLLAARALSDHFAGVTLFEADRFPTEVDNRKGVPQGQHAHGLLASGFEVMESFYPGLTGELVGQGATLGDTTKDVIWCLGGSYKHRFVSGMNGVTMSRPLLETTIRRRTIALPSVQVRDGVRVVSLMAADGRVTGVNVEAEGGAEAVAADLVLDATGRGSRAPAWLESLGYSRPAEETVEVGVGYTTRVFLRRPQDFGGASGMICGIDPPDRTRFGVALRMEGERWIVTLGGFLGDHTPAENDAFLAFAASLPAPDIHEVLRDAAPLSDFATHKFPSNRRRRYERLHRFPEGYLVLGDGLCSFNPIYGQGMSVAACEARALRTCLDGPDVSDTRPLWRRFFDRATSVVDIAWDLASSADLAVDGVAGQRPPGFRLVNRYMERLQNVAAHDEDVCRAFFNVTNLLATPGSLFAPRIAWKVLSPELAESLCRRPGLGSRPFCEGRHRLLNRVKGGSCAGPR